MLVFTNLLYEKMGATAYLTVNRPKALNGLSRATLAEIETALLDARDDNKVHGVIVTGGGNKYFIAGSDISEVSAISAVEAQQFARRGHAVLDLIENLGKPVIAAVNGFALGAGCELAMACTLRIASKNASFGQPEVRLGIMPGFGGTQRLPRLVGKGRAMQLILTAANIDAHEAYRIGLVNEVVEPARLLVRAKEILRQIGANAPIALSLSMQAVNQGMDVSLKQGLSLESACFAICSSSEDKREGTSAFLANRQASFSGR